MQRVWLLVGMAMSLWLAGPVYGSGTYNSRPPQPGAAQKAAERAKYELGKKVFSGKIKLTAAEDAEKQKEPLGKWQKLLPARVAKKTDMTTWAGKLTAEQLDALGYYVTKRYGK